MQNNGTAAHQACASCKHQRKGCRSDCILAPYFPVEKTDKFQAVHKVFGVSNVQKLMRNLSSTEERELATKSLIWEAELRQGDPVNGSLGQYEKILNEKNMLEQEYKKKVQENMILKRRISDCPICSRAYVTTNKQNIFEWGSSNNNMGIGIGSNNNGICYPNSNGSYLLEPPYSPCLQGLNKGRATLTSISTPNQVDGFNQHYYLQDQFNHMDVKTMDDMIWERGT